MVEEETASCKCTTFVHRAAAVLRIFCMQHNLREGRWPNAEGLESLGAFDGLLNFRALGLLFVTTNPV